MQVATGALSPLLRKLGGLLVAEFTLSSRVKKGAQSLCTELEMMYVVLCKVGDMPAEQLDPHVRIWAGNVRELSYNMEDAVDAYMVRVYDGSHADLGPNNMKNRVKKFFRQTKKLFSKGRALHQISGAIQDAQELAKELAELRQRYALEASADGAGNAIDPRLKAVYRDVTELVGIEGIRDELIEKLLDQDERYKQQLKTLSIVGFGGLGKTTLARAVYDKIRAQFSCGVFVSMSRNPDITKIFKKILYGLESTKFANINEAVRDNEQLIDERRIFLQDKRYLIVIDDIWDEEAWEIIKCAFPKSGLRSRVMTTTRITSVAQGCCASSDDIIHEMKSLNDDDSKRLFYKRIFPQGSECPHELKQVSREILNKCGGVPLAIITIASLLASNDQKVKPKHEWDNILGSIGRGLVEGGTAKDMQRILSFSYYDLPSHLKTCLLYLTIFPEDHEINRDRLIWRWIAEGFIEVGEQEIRLFELGERYFSELVNRNLIQPAYFGEGRVIFKQQKEGRVISCRVHDIMLDFIVSLASEENSIQPTYIDVGGRAGAYRIHDMVLDLICSLSSEEDFVTILDGAKQRKNASDSMVRRLSLQNSMSELTTHRFDVTSMSKLRSVTLFRTNVDLIQTLPTFQVLRVLDLEGCELRENGHHIDLSCVENLLHLRYLGLKDTCVGVPPMKIGKLQFLQTLDLRGCRAMEMPSSVVHLGRLMCLYVDVDMRLPLGIGNLVSLEEVHGVKVGGTNAIEKELANLMELRVLSLFWEGDNGSVWNSLFASLDNLRELKYLYIVNMGDARFDDRWDGWVPPPHLHRFTFRRVTMTLPRWINSSLFPVLSELMIQVDSVRPEVDIQILGKLPALHSLWLRTTRDELTPVERFTIGHDAFPCLRKCTFANFQTGPSMFPQGSMPRLESLFFYARASQITVGDLDVDMRHLPSLQEVTVSLWSEENCFPEVQRAADMLKLALDAHPNRPTLCWFPKILPKM